jgi:hypothetical protein
MEISAMTAMLNYGRKLNFTQFFGYIFRPILIQSRARGTKVG